MTARSCWNSSRDNKTPLELFLAGVHGWKAGIRQNFFSTFAVQFAHWKGAHVLGTASTENQEFLRQLGVDQHIDYKKTCFQEVAFNVDVVLDTFGGHIRGKIVLKVA